MSQLKRDGLDVAIDRVATRLVSVEPDEILASRIAARLPERSRANWRWLAPQLAAATGVVLFALVMFSNRPTNEAESVAEAPRQVTPDEAPVSVTPAVAVAVASPVETTKRPAAARVDDSFDRDFGLKPVTAPEAITLPAIAVARAIDIPATEVEPIVLTDLPMASDSPSPR